MLCATISKLSLLIALALAGVAAAEPAAPSDAEVLEAFRAADPAVRDGLLALLEEATADEAHGRELEKKPKEYKIKIDKEVDDDGKIVKEKIAVGSKKTAKKALASLAKNLEPRCGRRGAGREVREGRRREREESRGARLGLGRQSQYYKLL